MRNVCGSDEKETKWLGRAEEPDLIVRMRKNLVSSGSARPHQGWGRCVRKRTKKWRERAEGVRLQMMPDRRGNDKQDKTTNCLETTWAA